jgi:hypothetical protein
LEASHLLIIMDMYHSRILILIKIMLLKGY